jgi:hypothetical protein
METENCQRQLSKARVSSFTSQSVLIVNQNSASWAADKCDSLRDLVRRFLAVRYIQNLSKATGARTNTKQGRARPDVAKVHGHIKVDSRVTEMIERGRSP